MDNDFADFSQVPTQPSNNDEAFGSFGGMQMNAQEDAFAGADVMGGMSMPSSMDMNQGFGSSSAAPADDYSEEELMLLRKVEEENESRKRMLYEKLQKESEMKRERKATAQMKL
jgi:hypothetical protein